MPAATVEGWVVPRSHGVVTGLRVANAQSQQQIRVQTIILPQCFSYDSMSVSSYVISCVRTRFSGSLPADSAILGRSSTDNTN